MSERSRPIADMIFDQLEAMIAEGQLANNQRLDEVQVSKMLGVSRTPLREALRRLSAAGLSETIPNRGTFVRKPDLVRLVEMFEVVAEMEAWCARLAATRITPAQLVLLNGHADACEKMQRANDQPAYYAQNEAFHQLIYQASGNTFLAEETSRVNLRLKAFRKAQLFAPNRLAQSAAEHRAILGALEAQDAQLAEQLARDHVRIQSSAYQVFSDS